MDPCVSLSRSNIRHVRLMSETAVEDRHAERDLSAGSRQSRQCGSALLNHDVIANSALGVGSGHFELAARLRVSDDDIFFAWMKSMLARSDGVNSRVRYP